MSRDTSIAKRSLRIGFFTSLGVNVGDEFIREGIRAILDRAGVAYQPFYVNKVDSNSLFAPKEDEVEVVADKFWDCDLFIQAGAPVYWHLCDGQSTSLTSEWHQWMWEDCILKTTRSGRPRFINLGAGACDVWSGNCESFLGDEHCRSFARSAAQCAMLTTVRDPVAAGVLEKLDLPHHALPCPAFLAGARHQPPIPADDVIGVNLMPIGGHYDLAGNFDSEKWKEHCEQLCRQLRTIRPLVFICHDRAEAEFAASFTQPGERIFLSSAWRDYIDMYGRCAIVVANRVHGAILAAGLGVPSLIIGNDTRARIGEYVGVPAYRAGGASPEGIFDSARQLFENRALGRQRLLQLREQTIEQYVMLLKPILESIDSNRVERNVSVAPNMQLAKVDQISSPPFTSFMNQMNTFAGKHDLRQFTNWSKVWEYPWLWFNALGRIDWNGKTLLDLGSEISPMPWFIAQLGAKVKLIETDPQFQSRWQLLREKLRVDVDWKIVDSEQLPLEDESVDVLTSFSVIEHQPDKARAIAEAVRVLKPGGIFAISFDICEPEMGMTFPQWNGRALTMRDFEALLWNNLAFHLGTLNWNTQDIPEFKKWHLLSAPHHNYVVGAAVLIKR